MKRSYRDNKPRFHKHRQGKMLLPHNQLSGLFFTVNPRQEPRAQREAQLYLSTLTHDLEAAQEAFAQQHTTTAPVDDDDGSGSDDALSSSDAVDTLAPTAPDVAAAAAPSASLSSLLAAELAACSAQSGSGNRYNAAKRARAEGGDVGVSDETGEGEPHDGDDEDGEGGTRRRRDAPQRRREWFAPLETGCKGYLFLNVPVVNAAVTCPKCHAAPSVAVDEQPAEASDAGTALSAATRGATVPHTIVINPLVSRIAERIFEDLDANPRPIFRNCFRLMPAELTCCPTLPEMQAALRELLALHFSPATLASSASASDKVDFDQPIPLPSWGASPPQRSMHTVALQLTVKNNTNVEKKKAVIAAALTAAIPANRFIVVAQPSSKTKCTVEATVCIFVAHATCVMGLQRRVTERRGFNLHAVGEEAFVLSNSVQAPAKQEPQP